MNVVYSIKRKYVHRYYFVVVVLAAVLNSNGLPSEDFDFTSLDQLVESELRQVRCPGASIAVVHGDEIIYAKGYGVANVETGAPVTSDMLFRLGSTTKMFTAAGLLLLVDEGKLKLNSPIGDYVDGLDPSIARLTSHQLLTHTSGLADFNAMNGPHDESALETRVQAITARDFFDEPATIYSYSNSGYWTAGLVIQSTSERLYANFLDERIFKPLMLKQTTFRPTVAMTWPLAIGHGPEDRSPPMVIRPLADNAAAWPAGQLFSTAPEFARFCIAFMNDGKIDDRQVLPPFVIEQLTTPHVPVPNEDRCYGYGLSIRDVQGLRWIWHSGSRTGYGSFAKMCPEKKFAIVILCNKTAVSLTGVADEAAKIVLGTEPAEMEKPSGIAMDADEIERYVGVYANGLNTHALSVVENQLSLSKDRRVIKVGERHFMARASKDAPGLEFSLVINDHDEVTHLMARGRAFKKRNEQDVSTQSTRQ